MRRGKDISRINTRVNNEQPLEYGFGAKFKSTLEKEKAITFPYLCSNSFHPMASQRKVAHDKVLLERKTCLNRNADVSPDKN